MQNLPDTPDERLRRRRVRRWKRRARILGPFLGVPLLLLILSLSVDLVEYQPQEKPDRLTDRPIRMNQQQSTEPTMRPSLLAPTGADSAIPTSQDNAERSHSESIALDVTLPSAPLLRPPTPPSAIRRR